MLPASALDGLSDQVTVPFVLPVTCALKGCVCPVWTVAVFGLTVTVTPAVGSSVTWAVAQMPPLQQAVTVAVALVVTEEGAVYFPVELIVP